MTDRPDRIHYYLGEAIAVAARAECKGQHVGAVIVGSGERVLSTGYNGAPEGWGNCSDGDVCYRCDHRDDFGGTGNAYDKCICVHAEMNAISAAARYGMALDGATVYVTHQPCFTCAKELIQAGIARAYYAVALPVGCRTPHDLTQAERVKDLALKRTEAKLLGQLNAVHVKTPKQMTTSLRGAIRTFERESADSVKRDADAARDITAVIEAEKLEALQPLTKTVRSAGVNTNGRSRKK